MKDIYKYLLCLLLLVVVTTEVEALSVDKNNINISVNSTENIELYANVENATKVEFNLTYSTYDIPAQFIINNSFKDEANSGIKHIILFDEVKTGKILLGTININVIENPKDLIGSVNINNAKSFNSENNSTNLKSQSITIKVNKKEEEKKVEIDKNLLDKIDSNIVNIKLEKDIFVYDVNINEDIKELDLKPIAKDNNTEVSIDTQKINELKDNKLIIKTKNNDIEQEYIINIKTDKKEKKVIIDKSIFKPNDSYKNKWRLLIIISSIVVIIGGVILFKKEIEREKKKHYH